MVRARAHVPLFYRPAACILLVIRRLSYTQYRRTAYRPDIVVAQGVSEHLKIDEHTHTQLIVLRRNTRNQKMDLKYFKINKKIHVFLPCPNCPYNTSGDPTRRRTTGARGPLVAGAEVRRAGVCKDDCMQKKCLIPTSCLI